MLKPLLGFALVLGSLLVLVPKPTTGFTYKLLGDEKAVGETPIPAANKITKTPMIDDAFPDPKEKFRKVKGPTSDALPDQEEKFRKVKAPTSDALPDTKEKFRKVKAPTSDALPDTKEKFRKVKAPTSDALPDTKEKFRKVKAPTSDALPDTKEKFRKVKALTSDEVNLDKLAKTLTDAQIDAFLTKYGYLGPPINGTVSAKDRKIAVMEFQKFSRLSATGIVDSHTKNHMEKPRCGVPDPVSSSKFAEFNARGRKWSKNDLTYKIVKFSRKLSRSTVRDYVKRAFGMWAAVSKLSFKEVLYGSSDLEVKFTARVHGDGEPFDGPGGTLAHAFFPPNGQIHLEEAENWSIKSYKGTNLLFVLVHEIGHALGLGHSKVDQSIMEPVYTGYRPNLKLEQDDIDGIQFLYGKSGYVPPRPKPPTRAPVTRAPVTRAPVTPSGRSFPCPFYLGAIMKEGVKTYGFRGFKRYEILNNGKMTNGRSISSVYSRGPFMVGAAAHDDTSGRTFLFENRKVWRYTNNRLDTGFPKTIKYYVRAANVVYGQVIAFSFTHVHYLDQDTLEDYVDGDVKIKEEYPALPDSIRAAVSFGGGVTTVFSVNEVVQVDIFTGEIKSKKRCKTNYNLNTK